MLVKTGVAEVDRWDATSCPDTVSYSLLRLASNRSDIFESLIRNIRLSNGVYRSTYRNRFADVDQQALRFLAQQFGNDQPFLVHDWAASDCLSSAQLARLLFRHFPNSSLCASDISMHLIEVSTARQTYIFEQNGAPLQYILPPLVVSLTKFTNYPVNRLATVWARRRSGHLAGLLKRCVWSSLDDNTVFRFPPWNVARIPLIHPEALALRKESSAFHILTHSVFSPLETPVDVIRTMNILNAVYFSPSELARGVVAVFNSLKPGGIWIVGRTTEDADKPENQVTIMRKETSGFSVLERLNGGWREDHTAQLIQAG